MRSLRKATARPAILPTSHRGRVGRRSITAVACIAGAAFAASTVPAGAAELILPENRPAFYSDEPIELAVAGLTPDVHSTLRLAPESALADPISIPLTLASGTETLLLPPYSLAPSRYHILLNGKDSATITVSSGVVSSSMLLSEAGGDLDRGKANFVVGSVAGFGLVGPHGRPMEKPRGHRSNGIQTIDAAIAQNRPTLIYLYWTGYTFHKPWGPEKAWAAPDEQENMRLMSLHVAQQLRTRYRNLGSVGTIDEPGLAYGRTPAGEDATGYPIWDEQSYYETRGWRFTNNPAARPDLDWRKYLDIRTGIIPTAQAQAKRDWKSVIPSIPFATDLYAPQAIMDGTDPLNQSINDIPTTHVFDDFGYGKLGIIGALYLEKAGEPLAKVAHAMNGQLLGKTVGQPEQSETYHLMLNALLAAGIRSNWWLNTGGMSDDELASINEPGERMGPLFLEMAPIHHDVAVLWSRTELVMREKTPVLRSARKANSDAYTVGGNYQSEILTAHQALSRAGYPAHILHEALLPQGALKNYVTLVVVHQTFPFPPEVARAIAAFHARGGKVIVDAATTVPIPGAIRTGARLANVADEQAAATPRLPPGAKPDRASSFTDTNFFKDQWPRKASPLIKDTMGQTASNPVFTTADLWLAGERHYGGEASLTMVLNGYEELPSIGQNEVYPVYNYAAHTATLTLQGIAPRSRVYRIDGLDWKTVTPVAHPDQPQTVSFEPGEMKLYFAVPHDPSGSLLTVHPEAGAVTVNFLLRGILAPWPITVRVTSPDGTELYHLYRATNQRGFYSETLPTGGNIRPGDYRVSVESPLGGLKGSRIFRPRETALPGVVRDPVRIFDESSIRHFLHQRPLTIAVANSDQRIAAERLAAKLRARKILVRVRPVAEVWRKHLYPRVWDPYITVFSQAGPASVPPEPVKIRITLELTRSGRTIARTRAGVDLGPDWRHPNTLATVVGNGFVDEDATGSTFYEPGVTLYVDSSNKVLPIESRPRSVKTSQAIRERWSHEWDRLSSYQGTYSLVPQLPEAYEADTNLILLGDSKDSELNAALQASELLPEVVDERYPGPGRAVISFARSPFALGRDVVLVGADDAPALAAGVDQLIRIAQ